MVSLLNTVRDLDRLRQIVGVLARHGFGEVVQRTGLGSLLAGRGEAAAGATAPTLGERIRLVLQDLGPSFIKLGQIVSTRPDLIPEPIVVELKKLQDDVPPLAFEVIRETVEAELGAPIAEVFERFDEAPLATASIGQVHRALLKTDEGPVEVVVKVQRPNVKQVIDRDVDLLYWLAHAIERSMPETRIYSPVKLVQEFDRSVHTELDFAMEADHAERFARNFEDRTHVKFPAVYRQASSRRVLTLEFLPGKKIYDAVASGSSGEAIAKAAVDIIIKQIFEDGFFHADPHPGNVLILGEPEAPIVAMIDLGMVGRLSPQLRDRTVDLMVAAVREDYRGIADALYAIGKPTKKVDRQAFEAEVTALSQKYLGKKLQEIELSAMIRDLVYGARKYGIEIPPDFLMMGKALMTVEGVGKEIYPALDVFEEVKPYFLQLMWQRYSPERLTQEAVRGFMRLSGAAAEMPLQLQEILDDLRKGSLTLQVRQNQIQHASDALGRRIFSGLVVAGLLLSGAVLIAGQQVLAGLALMALAAFWASTHSLWVAWLARRRAKRDR